MKGRESCSVRLNRRDLPMGMSQALPSGSSIQLILLITAGALENAPTTVDADNRSSLEGRSSSPKICQQRGLVQHLIDRFRVLTGGRVVGWIFVLPQDAFNQDA